jgi:nucleotide-binding universal stress UspA family protein
LVTSAVAEQPAEAMLEAGKVAQMLIVGRHTAASRHSGVRLGSTARSVLHQAGVPVAVVPLPTAAHPEGHRVAAPMWVPTY